MPYQARILCALIRLHHMDLYRLRGGFDLHVLDLPTVLERSVCLVEWPDRLGAAQPLNRLGESVFVLIDRRRRRGGHCSRGWSRYLDRTCFLGMFVCVNAGDHVT